MTTPGEGDTDDDCDNLSHTYWEAGDYSVELTVRAVAKSAPMSLRGALFAPKQSPGRHDEIALAKKARLAMTKRFAFVCQATLQQPWLTVSGAGGEDSLEKSEYIIVVEEPPVNQAPQAVIHGPTQGVRSNLGGKMSC